MKLKIILLIFIFGISTKSNSQNGEFGFMNTQFEYTQISQTLHNFSFTTSFAFGSPGNCFSFISDISFSGDTMFVKATYNICGFWPQQGCVRNDIVTYTEIIPANIQYIIMSTNVIECSGTNGEPTLVENVYTRTYDLNLSTAEFLTNSVVLFPNPVKDIVTVSTLNSTVIDKIVVYTLSGKKVIESTNTIISVENLAQGVYIVEVFSGEQKLVRKLVKE